MKQNRESHKWTYIVGIGLLVLLCIGAFVGCGAETSPPAEQEISAGNHAEEKTYEGNHAENIKGQRL